MAQMRGVSPGTFPAVPPCAMLRLAQEEAPRPLALVGGDMNRFVSPVLRLIDRVSPPDRVSAHCDVPCGIYDPHMAQIAALTVVRMNQLIDGLQTEGAARENSFVRYI